MAAAKKRILKQHFYEQIQLEQKEMELKVQRENDLIEFQRQQMVFQMQRQNQEEMERQMAYQIQRQNQERMELERQRALQFQRENQERMELERQQMAIKVQQENHAQLKRNLAAKLRLQQWKKRKNEENLEESRMKVVGEVPKYSFGNPRFTPYSECPQYIRQMYQHRQYYDPYQEESKDLQLSYHHNNYKQADPSPTTPIIQNTSPAMTNVNQPSGSPVNVHGIDRKGHDYNNGEYYCVCGTNYLAKKELFDHIREMCKLHGAWISCQL